MSRDIRVTRCFVDYAALEPRRVLTAPVVVADDPGTLIDVSHDNVACLNVTNTNDSGDGSLREAINCSNNQLGKQDILFMLPNGSDRKIVLESALPPIIDEVTIYGHTQEGFNFGDIVVELDGSNITDPETDGLLIAADYTEIFGLAIGGFNDDAIEIEANNVKIGSNYIGLDLSGAENANNNGVRVSESHEVEIFQNVISGNDFAGILIQGDSQQVAVQANQIGTNAAQTVAIPNYVGIMNQSRRNAIIDNVIAGNEWVGVALNNPAVDGSETTMLGNYVGVSQDGTQIANATTGVFVLSSDNMIGGSGAGQGNVIAGNGQHGIMFRGGSGNVVEGNFIGVTENDVQVANGFVGLRVIGSADFVARSNVISGNDTIGLFIGGVFSTNATISSNYIGTDSSGLQDMGNAGVGLIVNGAIGATISDNVISGNDKGGFSSVGGDTAYTFLGNKVGTDFTGTRRLNNTNFGLFIFSNSNIIGGGNVISDSNLGLAIGAGTGNTITQNYIGTDANEIYDLGMNFGIYFFQAGSSNTIQNNVIHHVVTGIRNTSTGTANQYRQNSFRHVNYLGIDNGLPGHQHGSTANGTHMVTPVLTEQVLIGNNSLELTYSVGGAVEQVPATVEFFVANFNGSGRTFVGSDIYTSEDWAAGDKTVLLDVTGMGLLLTDRIVATATDANGNTSEFSLMI
ncbi:MAG: right-handed parallel beta-helix repeat-containing protein [Planctomycetota bacterium]